MFGFQGRNGVRIEFLSGFLSIYTLSTITFNEISLSCQLAGLFLSLGLLVALFLSIFFLLAAQNIIDRFYPFREGIKFVGN
jgi:predicted RND superfamily exporter protein